MFKRRIAVMFPILALSLSVLACNFPGMQSLDAQASGLAEEEIAALVEAAEQGLQTPEQEAPPTAITDELR